MIYSLYTTTWAFQKDNIDALLYTFLVLKNQDIF